MSRIPYFSVARVLAISLLCLTTFVMGQDSKPAKVANPAVKTGAGDPPPKPAKQPFVPKITIGKATTWAEQPISPSGFIDYLAVINRKYSQGVTPENNAAVRLYQAMGPTPEGKRQPDEFFKLLGMEPLPDEGTYFEELWTWWARTGKPVPAKGNPQVLDVESDARSRPWTSNEFPEVDAWLHDIEAPLNLVKEATERPEYFSPVVSSDGGEGKLISVLLPGVQKSRSLARSLVIRAMLHLGNKDASRAWSDLLTVHRLGRLVGRGPTLIEGLVGIAIESMAIDAELKLISETHPTAKYVARYMKQLENLPPRSLMTEKLDWAERIMFLDFCHQFARGRMSLRDAMGGGNDDGWATETLEAIVIQSADWDEVLKAGNRWYDRIVEIAQITKYQEREIAVRDFAADVKKLHVANQGPTVLLQLIGKPQVTRFASNVLISLLLPATQQCLRAESRCLQRMRNLEIVFALSAWRGEHDSYPQSLAELEPKYLKQVPIDVFNEQPLHYEKTADGFRLYSVGENGTDDQGQTSADKSGADDLVVQLPIPRPVPRVGLRQRAMTCVFACGY